MRNQKLTKVITTLCVFFFYLYANAQVTTATMSGTILSADKKPLSGATVKIVYAEAGINKTIPPPNRTAIPIRTSTQWIQPAPFLPMRRSYQTRATT